MEVLQGIGETLLFGITAHVLISNHKEQLAVQKLFNTIQKTRVLSPSSAMSMLNIPEVTSSDLSDIMEGPNFIKGLGIFSGTVAGEQIISSLLNSSIKLVVSELSLEKLISNSRIDEEIEDKRKVLKVSEFSLSDPKVPGCTLMVENSNKMKYYQDALSTIKIEEFSRSLSFVEKFINWITFSLKLFLSVNNFGKKISGFNIGIRRIERGIVVGQLLTIFGEFVYDRYNRNLRIVNPIYFMKDKGQMLKYLQDANTKHSRNIALLLTLMTIFSVMILKRLIRFGKGALSKYINQVRIRATDSFYRLSTINIDNINCMKCKSHSRSVIFKPCLHLCVCWLCNSKMSDRSCPQCKRNIEDSVSVFIV